MPKEIAKKPRKLSLKKLNELTGDRRKTEFFLSWIKHGRDATKAYLELHPNVTTRSASVLGSQALANIDIRTIAYAYGLNHDKYMNQLLDGIDAVKFDQFTGEKLPDHKIRSIYHSKLGSLLGIESNQTVTGLSVKDGDKEIKVVVVRGQNRQSSGDSPLLSDITDPNDSVGSKDQNYPISQDVRIDDGNAHIAPFTPDILDGASTTKKDKP